MRASIRIVILLWFAVFASTGMATMLCVVFDASRSMTNAIGGVFMVTFFTGLLAMAACMVWALVTDD